MKKLKMEHDKKLKEYKKSMLRETKFKSETLDRESKQKIDREAKKHKEAIEDYELKIDEINQKVQEEKKKYRELGKSNLEKHKAEIRNLKNNNENELKRKQIEHEKELKKISRDHEIEVDNLLKENEVQLAEKLLSQKKELNTSNTQKFKLDKSKLEQEFLDKENELNNKFSQKEAELHKKHEEEIEALTQSLTQKNTKLIEAAVGNAKAEVLQNYRQEIDQEVESVTEHIRNEYHTENKNLRLQLQEAQESQSCISAQDYQPLHQERVIKEDESVQTNDIAIPINAEEAAILRESRVNGPFDYEVLKSHKKNKINVGQSQDEVVMENNKSINTARTDQELVKALYDKNRQEMNRLQNSYENRITDLLESHMDDIQSTKKISTDMAIQKLERIIVLELDKMKHAIMCKSREEASDNNKSANLIIAELIVDLSPDNSTHENLERIKKKLNEVLIKYKEKVDFKLKHRTESELVQQKRKLQEEFERMRTAFEKQNESPSVMDTGIEHDSPEKRVRQSIANKEFSDFTKDYKLCDKAVYEKNILTKVSPSVTDKAIVVDLKRVVTDMNMIKNTLAASARKIGFNLVEPHKIQEEEYQEQMDPNIPEPVYNTSEQYRHLLNTFLRFSRDVIQVFKGDINVNCFKEESDKETKTNQQIMEYKLKVSDMKDKLKKYEREHKLLQGIIQNHLEGRFQIINFQEYDKSEMEHSTRKCIEIMKETHEKLTELQTIFIRHGSNMEGINNDCDRFLKYEDELSDVSFNNIEFDAS